MQKNSKYTEYIDSSHYLDDPSKDMSTYIKAYNQIDPVRANSNLLWTQKEGNIIQYNKSDVEPKVVLENINDIVEIKANKKHFSREFIDKDGLKRVEFDVEAWEKYINNTITPSFNGQYEDFYFKLTSLKHAKQLPLLPSQNMAYANREFVYNFYSPSYESTLLNQLNDINSFPSFLNVFNDPKIDSRTYEENLKLSLGGIVPNYLVDSLVISKEYNDKILKYFEIYAELRNSEAANVALTEINKQSNNIIVDNKKTNDLNTFSYVPFPYYADIKFTNLSKDATNFIHSIDNIGQIKNDLQEYLIGNVKRSVPSQFIVNDELESAKAIKTYNLKNWLKTSIETSNFKAIEYGKLLKYINENIKPLKRSYNELVSKPSHAEILLYKIEKRQFNSVNEPLQVIWISPNNKSNLRYIDTQLKYSTEYYYTIVAYTMVVGNQYKYSKYNYSKREYERDIENGIYKVNLLNNASYKIFEIPLITLSGAIHEAPVTKPKVKIVKKDSTINISLDNSESRSYEKFTIIENKEYKDLRKIIDSQENEDEDKVYSYRSSNNNRRLQIYKLAQMPQDFLSFQGKLYKTINIDEGNSFEDTILPQIKYYYLFRYLNNHNIPSNVSDIYEVEMKDEEGYTYLNVKKFDIYRRLDKKISKGFKKYLLLRPSIIQTQIQPYDQETTVENIKVGPETESVWNKDFILRITSKQSNRVLEFNLKSIINKQN